MNKQQQKWFNYFLESGDSVKAVEVAYPDVSKANRSSKACNLRKRFALEIDKASRETYGQHAPTMLNVIKTIALDCDQPAVKLKAASEWLTRAGHDAAQVVELKETATHEQLLERLKIAMTGLPQEVINAALPKELLNQLSTEEPQNETTH